VYDAVQRCWVHACAGCGIVSSRMLPVVHSVQHVQSLHSHGCSRPNASVLDNEQLAEMHFSAAVQPSVLYVLAVTRD
jgi:hypothetical protein